MMKAGLHKNTVRQMEWRKEYEEPTAFKKTGNTSMRRNLIFLMYNNYKLCAAAKPCAQGTARYDYCFHKLIELFIQDEVCTVDLGPLHV